MIFYEMIMNMVAFACLICTCSLMPKQLLDPGYYSFLKSLEMSVLENFQWSTDVRVN